MMENPEDALRSWIAGYYYGDAPTEVISTDVSECIKFLQERGFQIARTCCTSCGEPRKPIDWVCAECVAGAEVITVS